jgi:uncharacterized membrane protein YcaP (DUF421 family)
MAGMDLLGASPAVLAQVVLATVGSYFALLLLVRLAGQRSLLALSGTDIACVIALGAGVGRTALLAQPSLLSGVVALTVLFALGWGMSRVVRRARFGRALNPGPVVLIRDGLVDDAALRRTRLSGDDLRQTLRGAGVAHRDQVRLAVLERGGGISVLRVGQEPEPWLVEDLPWL